MSDHKTPTNAFSIVDGMPVEGTLKSVAEESDTDWAVDRLEEIIDDLRSGKLRGYCMVLGVPDEQTGVINNIATFNTIEAYRNSFLFMGGMDRLKHRMNIEIDMDEDEDEDDIE